MLSHTRTHHLSSQPTSSHPLILDGIFQTPSYRQISPKLHPGLFVCFLCQSTSDRMTTANRRNRPQNHVYAMRVVVDVENQGFKIGRACNRDSPEPFFKQAPGPSIAFVDGFCVRVEQVGKSLRRVEFLLRDKDLTGL